MNISSNLEWIDWHVTRPTANDVINNEETQWKPGSNRFVLYKLVFEFEVQYQLNWWFLEWKPGTKIYWLPIPKMFHNDLSKSAN